MYSVSVLDMFFASVCVVICVLMAYAFGYTCKMERLTKALQAESDYVDTLTERIAYHISDEHSLRIQHAYAFEEQASALAKTHREAMKKYKARCNAKLARQIDLIEKANSETITELDLTRKYDYSPLLSK